MHVALDTLVRGAWRACPQLGHYERSSRYPSKVRCSLLSVDFNYLKNQIIKKNSFVAISNSIYALGTTRIKKNLKFSAFLLFY